MKKVNWVEVEEATGADRLPQGGYVIEIVNVDDVPSYERLNIVFDIAEGEYAHKFADVPEDREWTHQFGQSYKESAERFFKGFLSALEKSNPGFSIAEWQKNSDERELIGLKLGAVINYYHGVSEKGTLKQNYNLARPMSVDKIRAGDFKVPEDRWSDEAKALKEEQDSKALKEEQDSGGSTGESSAGSRDKYSYIPF